MRDRKDENFSYLKICQRKNRRAENWHTPLRLGTAEGDIVGYWLMRLHRSSSVLQSILHLLE